MMPNDQKPIITFDGVSYTYPDTRELVLDDVHLQAFPGEFVLVAGPSGCGKSTLLRCINGLVPHFSGGHIAGRIDVAGLDPIAASPRVMSQTVGFVFQDPESQFVMDRVEDEIAFGMENAALPPAEMASRMQRVLDLLGITGLRHRMLSTLSGGEKQRVAIAAALALQPQVLVLDEPTSQLDPESAERVLDALRTVHEQLGLTVVLVEQRLERVLSYADRIVYVPGQGQPVTHGSPREILLLMQRVPPVVQVGMALGWSPLPLSLAQARANVSVDKDLISVEKTPFTWKKSPYLNARDLVVNYGEKTAVDHVSFDLYQREIVTLMGRNAAGKSSLLRALLGLVKLNEGSVSISGQSTDGKSVADICRDVGYLPQEPNILLFAETAIEELKITLRNHSLAANDLPLNPAEMLSRLEMGDKLNAYPRDMSVGERQRVALGAVMIHFPGLLILDEPTRGLDYAAKEQLVRLLRQWRDAGLAILVVTHDVEFAAHLADRVWLMDAGKIYAQGTPEEVFSRHPEFAPDMVRLFPGKGWLTPEAVIEALTSSDN